ncbi:hypothetical protein Tco_0657426 [Tanacetum coccineum]|uniref:Uncharacterized protein n=1 Tax=Tanacetum coccineum TaxID=301880 RepID=A0ABQ4XBI7_9ASTR
MSITKDQQQALDDALVPREQHLRIGNCNYRLSTTFKPKEPTFQIALDALSLTPFYQAFLISVNVLSIYMHEFWATVSFHKPCIKFKLNTKNYSFDLETFRDMLQIYPNLPGQKFVDPPFEEEILTFIRKLGYSRDIKSLPNVKVDTLHQPWRTFGTIINKCLSGKVSRLKQIRLYRAQIIWGMYYQKNVDYVYLLWEHLVYQIENKESKRIKDMYYPRFTKVIINHFMSKDQSIPRRNKVDWHMARDDPILTIMRYLSKHEVVQKYGAILPDTLTNQEMKESDAYKTYYAFASGKEIPKSKYVRPSTREKTVQAPKASPGQRLKTTAKVAKSGKKKLPATVPKAKGLETLSEVALSEDEQMKIATKRSKTQFHSSHASGSGDRVDTQSKVPDEQQQKVTGIDEGAGDRLEVPDVPKYDSENDEEFWTFSQDDDEDEKETYMNVDSEETESNNDGDDFTHPSLSTYKADDQEEEEEKADDDEVSSDQKVSTPPVHEFTEEEENQEGDDYINEGEQEEEEEEDLYRDVNVNLERSDVEMTDAQANQETDNAHVTLTTEPLVVQHQSSSVLLNLVSKYINPSSDIGIDSILNQDTQSDSLVNVPVSVAAETPSYVSTIPQPPNLNIQSQQQTPISTTTTTIPITTLPDIPNFASVFRFDQRVSALETEMYEFKQTNKFVEVVSSILGIVDNYLAFKLKEVVDAAVQLQSNKLREEAQAENQEFLNQVDSSMKAIIKDQVKAQVSKIMPKVEK